MNRQTLARWGEDLAAAHALSRGYRILARNYRCRLGEVDLILSQDETVVFAEVKTRRGKGYGAPYEAVTPPKQQRLKNIAFWYADHCQSSAFYRFDVVSVLITDGKAEIDWYEDAFQ